MKKIYLPIIFLFLISLSFAKVTFNLDSTDPANAKIGDTITATFSISIEDGWHIYANKLTDEFLIPTVLSTDASRLKLLSVKYPEKHLIDLMGLKEYLFEGKGQILLKAIVKSDSEPVYKLKYQACNEKVCLPPTEIIIGTPDKIDVNKEQVWSGESKKLEDESFVSLLILAMFAGLLALVMPCVYPMIPLTISFFTKQAQEKNSSPVKLAIVYGVGITIIYILLGVLIMGLMQASLGSPESIAANPLLNAFIAIVFIVFAFSFFGLVHINPPRFLSGVSGGTRSGFIGVFFLGLTFSITSFACTAPFVGTLLVAMAKTGSYFKAAAGMGMFGLTLAIPFSILAIFPSMLKKTPKSGSWMEKIKIFMGFVELAAAFKFVSNVDLVLGIGIFTRDAILIIWILIFVASAAYLAGFLKIGGNSTKTGKGFIIAGIVMVLFSGYLATGIGGGKLNGNIDAFLPPYKGDVHWIEDWTEARIEAQKRKMPILIDFSGVTCTNCRKMEASTFVEEMVMERLENFVNVRLITDTGIKENIELKKSTGTVANPVYQIRSEDGNTIIDQLEGYVSKDEFLDFLNRAESKLATPIE